MGFFDNLKNSLTETGQDLSQKAKDTTEIFRLTNLNKTKEKEIEKVIYQIGSTYYANYRDECMEKMPELAAQIKSLQDEIAVNKEMIEKLSTEEICPQCGKKVNPGSKFCIYCGAALEAPTEQPEEKAEVKASEKAPVKAEPEKKEAAKAIETKKDTTKKLETKAAVLVDTPETEEKAAVKKSVKAPAKAEKKAPVKKAASKKAELKTEMFLQFAGKEYTDKEIFDKIKSAI